LYLCTYIFTGENMTNDEIINLAIENTIHGLKFDEEGLLRFAKLVAQHERERIKQANAPEIERVNAHIKKLEDAVLAEREACAKVCDDHCGWTPRMIGSTIRARGQA
jgi:ElaB/YqjD/DUF883 family membrane-anchored ribosome-binding protein